MNIEVGEYPILLDDVLSELDDSRQSHLLSTIQHKVQTFNDDIRRWYRT